MMATATTENARPRCDGSNVSRMMDCWFGCSPPPKKPCSRRNTTSSPRLVAMPHRNEHTVNMATQSRKYCLRPSTRPNQPEIGSDDAVGDQVGRQRPSGVVIAGGHAAGDMRQADIDDGGIQDLHERRHGHHDGDQPRVGAWMEPGVAHTKPLPRERERPATGPLTRWSRRAATRVRVIWSHRSPLARATQDWLGARGTLTWRRAPSSPA